MTAGIKLESETVIRVANRSGVWNVATNGKFHGDYARREWAMAAAHEKLHAVMRKGGRARIVCV
jgi:hypothetical protein